MQKKWWYPLLGLTACLVMMLAVALRRDAKIFGFALGNSRLKVAQSEQLHDIVELESDGSVCVYTAHLADDVWGYAGPVPLKIVIRDGRVDTISVLENDETPRFIKRVERQLLPSLVDMPVQKILRNDIDAVSGATYSSRAVIASLKRGLAYAQDFNLERGRSCAMAPIAKFIVALLVTLSAAILPFFIRSKIYRIVQLSLNVVVLGFWCGLCISYSLLIGYLANGVKISTALIPLLLIVIAFIFPLFGKKSYYCTWLCPFGALQELVGKCFRRKLQLTARWYKWLGIARRVLWLLLMLLLWSGVCFTWVDYEPFAAFMLTTASWAVLAIALVFVALSLVVNRPYCRFVCPTGTLLRLAQGTERVRLKK